MRKTKDRIEYEALLKSGMFWEFFPKLTGEWEKDKCQWNVEYAWLCKFRNSYKV